MSQADLTLQLQGLSLTSDSSAGPKPSLEEVLSRHQKELRDLQGRITQKKRNATKRTRKGINSECESLEQELKARHQREIQEITQESTGETFENKESEEEKKDVEGYIPPDKTSTNDAYSPCHAECKIPRVPELKKRPNRAKARLAKRAAQLESLSKQAAEEATSIPDLKTTEQNLIRPRIKALNLEEKDIPPDGHCLYSAFADQLEWIGIPLQTPLEVQTEADAMKPYAIMRIVCAQYMEQHAEDFAPFLEEDISAQIHKIANTAEWGGQVEVLALAKAYGVVANIVQAQGRIEKLNEDETEKEKRRRKEIWLAYYRHSFGLGEHYNSLRENKEGKGIDGIDTKS